MLNNPPTSTRYRGNYLALSSATVLLTLNFWVWSLLSPLAIGYQQQFDLSALAVSVLVALPVLVGSLAKILFGLLTDRFGGRRMFVTICFIAALAASLLGFAHSYTLVTFAAILIGITGASFAIGTPFVNAWFPKEKRGVALGVYSIGNGGTAIAGLLTPMMVSAMSTSFALITIGLLLFVAGVAMALWGKDGPDWQPISSGIVEHFRIALQWDLTWKLALLYSLTFGAFVAFGLYLPVILVQSYQLDPTDAAARAAGFVIIATIARPIGGWLSDTTSGLEMLKYIFLLAAILGALTSFELALLPIGTIAYLGLALTLGLGNGAIFAVIGHRCKSELVGAVNGLVAAAGGLGGFFPPLLLGLSFQLTHSYTIALGLFSLACLMVFASLRKLFGYTTTY